jgi:hypothetical protein
VVLSALEVFVKHVTVNLLVIGMQQCRPEVMPGTLPVNFSGAVLEPVGQSHVTVRQVDGICSSRLRCNRVLLRQHKPHDLAQLHVLQEELDMR